MPGTTIAVTTRSITWRPGRRPAISASATRASSGSSISKSIPTCWPGGSNPAPSQADRHGHQLRLCAGRELVEENYLEGLPIDSLFTYAMTKRMLYVGLLALQQQFGLNIFALSPRRSTGRATTPTAGRCTSSSISFARSSAASCTANRSCSGATAAKSAKSCIATTSSTIAAETRCNRATTNWSTSAAARSSHPPFQRSDLPVRRLSTRIGSSTTPRATSARSRSSCEPTNSGDSCRSTGTRTCRRESKRPWNGFAKIRKSLPSHDLTRVLA